MNLRKQGLAVLLLGCSLSLSAQALRGTTGLLHAPTADMEKDKTIKIGGNVLRREPLMYDQLADDYTFNYYLNITIFPWLEVGYTCTINQGVPGSGYWPVQTWGKYRNQDRSFYGRLRLWKEGWWKEWTPQIVLGLDDPGTHQRAGGGNLTFDRDHANAYFMRYYLAATKHFAFQGVGTLGAHLSAVWDRPAGYPEHKRPAAGVNFRFQTQRDGFAYRALDGLNLMAEYDVRTVNVGGSYSLWKDRINLIAELNDGKYFSGGIYFKVCLK